MNGYPKEPGKVAALSHLNFNVQVSGLTPAHWQAAAGLPRNYQTKAWESLLLEAEAHLPDLVPAIVLSAAALEVLIGNSLAAIAPTTHPAAELWHYMNNRREHQQNPSVADEFDTLLRILAGHSLKDRMDLWEAAANLRSARNDLVHRGTLTIGGRQITDQQAFTLVGRAKEIADWIESLLPEASRRPAVVISSLEVHRPVFHNRMGFPVTITGMKLNSTSPISAVEPPRSEE